MYTGQLKISYFGTSKRLTGLYPQMASFKGKFVFCNHACTVYGKMFEGKNFCGFCGFSLHRESFPQIIALSIGNISLQTSYTQTQMCAHIHIHTNTCTHTHIYTHSHIYTHIHTHVHTHTHTDTHTQCLK